MKNIFIRFNLMVLFTLLLIKFAINPLLENYALKMVDSQMEQYYGGLVKGPYFLIMQYLEGVQESDIPDRIGTIKNEFGFPIEAVKISSEGFTTLEKRDLKQGKTVFRSQWTLFYRSVKDTDWAIKLGPIGDLDQNYDVSLFNVIVWVTLICLVCLISLVAAYPFWKNLKELMQAAERFGEGDLSSRALLTKGSPLKQMAERFNQMAERIEQLIRSQKLLINAVSHELRTPISRIRFGMEMLELEHAKEKNRIKKYETGIMEDLDDLESLVSELLTYAMFDRNQEFINPCEIKTAKWVQDVVLKLEPLLGTKHIELNLSEAPHRFRGDAKLLSRALENLILNAIRYAHSKIFIQVMECSGQLKIDVMDDGPGIPDQDVEKIFEPFVRLDESRNRESGGFGLGLAIVRQIIAGHKGRVCVKKRIMQGACFSIFIPLS